MTALLIFWTLVLVTAALLAALRDVLADDPRGSHDYRPPRSRADEEPAGVGSPRR